MTKAKMIKNMVKAKKESVMGKLGDAPYEDPMEPWSSKYSAPVKNEEVELEEGAFSSGALKPSQKALDAISKTPSSGTVRGKDDKGVYTSKTVNGKEVSRSYEKSVKEDVEQSIDEATMTGIEIKKSKGKLDSDTISKHDVHYNGKKIGHVEAYQHRSGVKYGWTHHASGDAETGDRSMTHAIAGLRSAHAEHLKNQKDSSKEATKSLIKLAKMKEDVEQIDEAGFVDVSHMSDREIQRLGHADDADETPRRSYNRPVDHPHSVHINGKKWKTFGSHSHASNVARKIKGATVHREEVENDAEALQEDSWLFSYIRSLGYNPKIMNFAQRSKYARSNAFKHWKQSHMERRPGQTAAMEEVEHVDEMDKSQPSSSRGAEGLPLGKKADPVKTDKVKKDALKTLEKSYKKVKEEVETLDEAGTGLLMTYIKAKGLNPLTMDGNQKQAYSRSSEFKVFKQKHAKVRKEEFERLVNTYGADNLAEIVMQIQETSGMGERGDDWNEETGKETPPFDKPYKKIKGNVTDKSGAKHTPQSRVRHLARLGADKKTVKEEADKADTVTMDIPLLIRVLEYAREDAKTDMDLHKVVENLIKMRDGGTLSMAEYDEIVSIKEAIEHIQELKKMPDNMDYDDHITREDLRQWFSKTHPEGGWKRINSKGEAIGPCAREPGEPKPKCMSNEKRAKLSKKERAAAVAAKRKYDPVADRAGKGGKPVNVSNFGKGKLNEAFELLENHIAIAMGKMLDDEGSMTLGQLEQMERALEMVRAYVDKEYDKQLPAWVQAKITLATDYIDTVGNYLSNKNEKVDEASSPAQQAAIAIAMKKAGKKPKNEEVEQIDEKNSPTNPKLWSRAKAMARSKFDVYPSAYANGWASKWYKSKGGGWKSVKEDVVQEGIGNVEDSPMSATNSVKAMESAHRSKQMKSARMIKSLYKNKIKETTYDWEKDDKPNAKIVVKGGTTMTGQPRDTVEIEPVLRTRPNQVKPTV